MVNRLERQWGRGGTTRMTNNIVHQHENRINNIHAVWK